jgi:hypothetical protein
VTDRRAGHDEARANVNAAQFRTLKKLVMLRVVSFPIKPSGCHARLFQWWMTERRTR